MRRRGVAESARRLSKNSTENHDGAVASVKKRRRRAVVTVDVTAVFEDAIQWKCIDIPGKSFCHKQFVRTPDTDLFVTQKRNVEYIGLHRLRLRRFRQFDRLPNVE